MTGFDRADAYARAAQEDRSAVRGRIAIPAELRASGTRRFHTIVSDLSLSGFCASSVQILHPGTVCWLTLPGMGPMQSEIIWWEDNRCGGAFDRLLSPFVLESLFARHARRGQIQE
ncbi:PilZ domain-containing protein [Altererythrobacter xixiisoli]|uniref:PilZ domain-containing protein n=1 Tax=Croceibacterium xixiisoli TaxID=1476466 RepID=A0A6I4TV50_9SPHN|nr:PilZ domain-containing protein [Croceibacterium xixiisoli]MXO99099.1 PilZ domain-containing protein [Croceibacterium xixiisoli]